MYKKIILSALAIISFTASAQEIEEITVIGSVSDIQDVNEIIVTTLSEALQPTTVFVPGGVGGFSGFSERGTQPNHTAVYRNGVPVNDAGAGWYDLGHDLATGNEQVKFVSGPQGVLYGTSSMGGTVFINDKIQQGYVAKTGNRKQLISASPLDLFNVTYARIDNGSVRTDNTEEDIYKQVGARVQYTFFDDLEFTANYQDYDYDYDECYTADWSTTNDCLQSGVRQSFSIRNDNFTLGYSSNDQEFFTQDVSTYQSLAENYYFDVRQDAEFFSGLVNTVVGLTASKDIYMDQEKSNIEQYAYMNINNTVDFGVRFADDITVGKLGVSYGNFFASASTSYRRQHCMS